MESINERRNEFYTTMSEWFKDYQYSVDECYPFSNTSKLERELKYTWNEWGIDYGWIKPFGETLIIEGLWVDEGIRFHININPMVPVTDEFRTLIRWWKSDIPNTDSEN